MKQLLINSIHEYRRKHHNSVSTLHYYTVEEYRCIAEALIDEFKYFTVEFNRLPNKGPEYDRQYPITVTIYS